MEVHATSRSATTAHPVWVDNVKVRLHPSASLLSVLGQPRVAAVMLCAPETAETLGMIGAAELAALPRDAVLVNVGRGSLVQPASLRLALESGEIAGYAADVWWRYPRSFDEVGATPPWEQESHSLAHLSHTLLSPHRGGGIGLHAVEVARWEGIAAALNAAHERGLECGLSLSPLGVFDLGKGY